MSKKGAIDSKTVTVELGIRPAIWLDLTVDPSGFSYELYNQA